MLDHLTTDPFEGRPGGPDADSTLALTQIDWFGDGCQWRGSGTHRLAEVVDGRLDLTGVDGRVGAQPVKLAERQ